MPMRYCLFRSALHLPAALLILCFLGAPETGAVECDYDAWAFYGAVRDLGGKPIGDAEVFLLLDKVNEAAYLRDGVRGRRFRTNEYGKYQAGLVCGDNRDAPNPCAKKLKHLTVVVSSPGHAMKLQVHRLNDLEIVRDDGVCLVRMPEIRLQKGF